MKIAIVGCGAMGSVYAGLFAAAGHEVWAIDRWREHVEAMRSRGLRLAGPNRSVSTPLPHSHTRCTPCSRRLAALAADGASVRSAAL